MRGNAGSLFLLVRQLAARSIDSVVFGVVPLLLGLGYAWLVSRFYSTADPSSQMAWGFLALVFRDAGVPMLLVAASFMYEVGSASRSGQTPGKRWLGVRVLAHRATQQSAPTENAPFGRLTARWLVLHVPAIVLLMLGWLEYPAGDRRLMLYGTAYFVAMALPVVVTKSRRGAHDWVAGTVVVETREAVRVSRRGPGDVGFDRWQGFMRGGGFVSGSGS